MSDVETHISTNDTPPSEDTPTISSLSEEIQRLKEELTATMMKADAHWQQYLAAHAEMDNIRKRAERDKQDAHRFALERFAKALLPVIDSLEMGLNAATTDQVDGAKLREGTELTLRQLLDATDKFDIKPIFPQGEKFDPERHQAMTTQPTTEVAPNHVCQVLQKGYLLHDRLLRPALVIVAMPPPNPPQT